MTLYRYLPLKYLRELLVSKKLYFNQVTNWEDPYENFFLRQEIVDISGNPINVKSVFPVYYGECWTTLDESDAMWRIYSVKMDDLKQYPSKRDDIAIKIKIESDLIKNEIAKGVEHLGYKYKLEQVYYTDSEEIEYATRNANKAMKCVQDLFRMSLFVKRKAFEHEKEFRIIIEVPKSSSNPKAPYLLIPFNTSLINEYIIDPRLSQERFKEIKQELLTLGIRSDKIKKSKLYAPIKKNKIVVDNYGYVVE